MADIKNNWNKYRNSRADIEILQIAWSAIETAYKPSCGGGDKQLIKWSKTGQQGNKKIGMVIICILH